MKSVRERRGGEERLWCCSLGEGRSWPSTSSAFEPLERTVVLPRITVVTPTGCTHVSILIGTQSHAAHDALFIIQIAG